MFCGPQKKLYIYEDIKNTVCSNMLRVVGRDGAQGNKFNMVKLREQASTCDLFFMMLFSLLMLSFKRLP